MKEGGKLDNGQSELHNLILEVLHKSFMQSYSKLTAKKIHPGQCALLNMLADEDGITQKELAKKLNIKPPTVAVMVKRMEKNEYISKQTDSQDMRKTRIYITQKGKDVAKEVKEIQTEIKEQMYKGFTNEEIENLKKSFIKIRDNLKQNNTDEEITQD